MASIAKLNIEKATAHQLFRVVVKATDETNEASFTHGQNKRSFKVDIMAQGSEFYVPNIFRDSIVVTAKGYPAISTWSDLGLVNTKAGWESLGIVSSSLLSGVKYDHMHNPYPIPQTMAGVEINVDSEEFQAWYNAFTKFQPAAIFDAQHKISEIHNKYFEESNRPNRQKQSYYSATERWRDIKIALMNKLAKVKSHLLAQLTEELCKPMTDHKSYVEVRDSIELLVSMIEMIYCLQYMYKDHTTAIRFIDAQLEKINAHASFAGEEDLLEMIRTLHAARVESGSGKILDLELLLNQVGEIFKPEDEGPDS
jgi:hypothetical protein